MFSHKFSVSGIYYIKNCVTNTVYIGSATNIRNRWYKHRKLLQNNLHPNRYLQNAWNKYKPSNFLFKILRQVPKEALIRWEQKYLDSAKNKYNLRTVAHSNFGIKMTEKTNKKHSKIMKKYWKQWRNNHPKSIKIIKKRIPWNKGKKLPKWICNKLSKAKLDDPTSYWNGKKRSKITNLKISKKLKGRILSTKHAKNIGLGHKGLLYKKG